MALVPDAGQHAIARPLDPAGLAWWYATHPVLVALAGSLDTEAILYAVANCVDDLTAAGPAEAAVAVLERLFVEAHATGEPGQAAWCGWLLAGFRPPPGL